MRKLLYLLAFGFASAFSLQGSAATLAIGAEPYLPPTDRLGSPSDPTAAATRAAADKAAADNAVAGRAAANKAAADNAAAVPAPADFPVLFANAILEYTKRPWAGLTPEEVLDLFDVNNVYGSKWIEFARTVENKLKEKNG